MKRPRGLRLGRRGGVGVLLACAMPLLLGIAAFAVDYGTLQLDARRLQGVADAAAMAAAGGDGDPLSVARTLATASWGRATVTRAIRGRYVADAAIAPVARFQPGSGNAVQVELSATSPTFFANIFGINRATIVRRATAQRRASAAFTVGSRLVGIDGGLLNQLFSGLTGGTVSLGVLDYRAMSDGSVDVIALLDRLKLRLNVSANTYGELLATQVRVGDVLAALADTLAADGQSGAADAVRRLAAATPARSIDLAALVGPGPLARTAIGQAGIGARSGVLPFLSALLETGAQRAVAIDLGAGVPGLASVKAMVAVGERAQSSPWLTVEDGGTTVVRTAQTRIILRAKLAPTLLPGLSSLASVDLPLYVQLAGAEARLAAINCGATPQTVALEARVDPVTAAIGVVDETRLNDFATPLTVAPAKLLDTLLVDVTGSSHVSLGAAEPWQKLVFTRSTIDARTSKTIRTSTPIAGLAASLVGQATLSVHVIGLPIPVAPLVQAVGGLLATVAAPLDAVLASITGALGIGIGEADVTTLGLRCNGAAIVG